MLVSERDLEYLEGVHPPLGPVLEEMLKTGRSEGVPIVNPAAGRLLRVLVTALAGMITVDNVLWSGRIAAGEHDENTDALRAFNETFLHHEQLEATVLPVGDGFGIGVVRPHG